MDRCALANAYHEKGFNCCQSVLAAFGDITGLDERTALCIGGGFGGGVKTGEICGAASGAVMVIGMLFPHVTDNNMEEKKVVGDVTKEFLARFQSRFGYVDCRDLKKIKVPDDIPSANRLGITKHCAVLIVAAVELLEEMLKEYQK